MSEQPPYVVSTAFQWPNRAKAVYTQLEALIADKADIDLSAYNLTLNGQPFVIVVGNPPPGEVHDAIQRIMGTGAPVAVPASVVATLYRRSRDEWAKGPWRVHHHRPGKRLRGEE